MTKTDFVKIRLNKHMILYVDIPEELTIVETTALLDSMQKIQKIVSPSVNTPLIRKPYVRTNKYFRKEYDDVLIELKRQNKTYGFIAEYINKKFNTNYSEYQVSKRWWNIKRKLKINT